VQYASQTKSYPEQIASCPIRVATIIPMTYASYPEQFVSYTI
jgi:hypothetical protein